MMATKYKSEAIEEKTPSRQADNSVDSFVHLVRQ